MSISNELFSDFLRCKYKVYLILTGRSGFKSDYQRLQIRLSKDYLYRACNYFLKSHQGVTVSRSACSLSEVIKHQYSIVTNVIATEGEATAHFDVLIRAPRPFSSLGAEYFPVSFVRQEKLTREHKLLIAFCGLVLSIKQ